MILADSPAVPADEKMVDAEAQDTGAEVAADEAEGFPGGSSDSSVLTEYAKHVATNIWFGEVFIIFNLSYLLSIPFY